MAQSTLSLYLASILIWGSTWLVIKFQLGSVAPETSVAYRFLLAAVLLLGWCHWRGVRLRFSLREHLSIAAQGAFLFATNYMLIYHASAYLTSGLVAVVFSLIVFLNLMGMRIFFRQPIDQRVLLGAFGGIAGVALLFWPEVTHFEAGSKSALGLGLAVLSTMCASAGNLLAYRNNQRLQIPVLASTGWGMLYGGLLTSAYVAVTGRGWTFDPSFAYVSSLLYLAVLGSVAAFVSYLTLIARIGADRAGYVGVLVPVVALLISTVFEGYRWHLPGVIGLSLCLGCNLLVMGRRKEQPAVPLKPAATTPVR